MTTRDSVLAILAELPSGNFATTDVVTGSGVYFPVGNFNLANSISLSCICLWFLLSQWQFCQKWATVGNFLARVSLIFHLSDRSLPSLVEVLPQCIAVLHVTQLPHFLVYERVLINIPSHYFSPTSLGVITTWIQQPLKVTSEYWFMVNWKRWITTQLKKLHSPRLKWVDFSSYCFLHNGYTLLTTVEFD